MPHLKKVCRECLAAGVETIISQCRCPSKDKATTFGLCDEHSEEKVDDGSDTQ